MKNKIKLYSEEQVLAICKKMADEGCGATDEVNKEIIASMKSCQSKITADASIKEFMEDDKIEEIPVIFPSRRPDYSKFKHYRRFPIQLGHQSIIVIHHFSDKGEGMEPHFESHDFTEDNQAAFEYNWNESKIAAEQFFNQLEGHYCDLFLEALIVSATRRL